MKLWLLLPVQGLEKKDDPWQPWFDKAFGFVVRAENETAARRVAQANAGDEGLRISPWLEGAYATFVELTGDGEAGVVMRDFASA
jgi:hypothetical protein